jgi:hypothetical protein
MAFGSRPKAKTSGPIAEIQTILKSAHRILLWNYFLGLNWVVLGLGLGVVWEFGEGGGSITRAKPCECTNVLCSKKIP